MTNKLETNAYHIAQWQAFYEENQTDTYGEDKAEWQDITDLAEVWWEEEAPEMELDEDKTYLQTVWFSAGVFCGEVNAEGDYEEVVKHF